MGKYTHIAGIAIIISILLTSQTVAESGCISTACEPAGIPAKENKSGCLSDLATPTACDPAAVPAKDSVPGSISDYFASSAALDPDNVPAKDGVPGSISDYFASSAALDSDNVPVKDGVPGSISDYFGSSAALDSDNVPARAGASGSLSDLPDSNGLYGKYFPNERAKRYNNPGRSFFENFRFSGYLNTGCITNFVNDLSNGMPDCWSNSTPSLNAIYISTIKKAVTDGYGIDVGFGFDFMFGEDARLFRSDRGLDEEWITGYMYNPNTHSNNIPSYGYAIPQLYIEAAINNWAVKMGHFFGLLGYEGAPAPSRFFYSKGLTCAATPVCQTGFLVAYNGFQNFEFTLGWVNGWNNGFDNKRFKDGLTTGEFIYHINPEVCIKYAFLAGTADMAAVFKYWGPHNWGHTKGVGAAHSVVIDAQLTSRIDAVTTIYYVDFGQATTRSNGTRALILGEHLYYTINRSWKAGFRLEWMNNVDYYDGTSLYTEVASFAMGLNCHPFGNQRLNLRPELRFDKAHGDWQNQPLNKRECQVTAGFDFMMSF